MGPVARGASRFENLLAPQKTYWPPKKLTGPYLKTKLARRKTICINLQFAHRPIIKLFRNHPRNIFQILMVILNKQTNKTKIYWPGGPVENQLLWPELARPPKKCVRASGHIANVKPCSFLGPPYSFFSYLVCDILFLLSHNFCHVISSLLSMCCSFTQLLSPRLCVSLFLFLIHQSSGKHAKIRHS